MSDRKPEDRVVTVNAHDFLKAVQIESNKLAMKGVVVSGKSLFNFVGRIFTDKVKEQRAKEAKTDV